MRTRSRFFWPALSVLTTLSMLTAIATASFGSVAFAGSSPTISSDRADYAPGDTVSLSGSGWDAAEAVHIFVNDNDGQTWSHSADVTADDQGNISDSFQLPDWFIATYYVTATGATSGTATTTFTDSNVTAKAAGYSSVSFTLIRTTYSLASCAGTATGPTSVPGISTTSGDQVGLLSGSPPPPGPRSVKWQAAATSDQGSAFVNWSSSGSIASTTTTVARPLRSTQPPTSATVSSVRLR